MKLINQETNVIYTKDMLDYEINVYGTEEDPLFLAKDIADWLDARDSNSLIRIVSEEEKVKLKVPSLNGNQITTFVTEDGLYEICMRSNLPKAKKVRKFIKGILKELRTKGYVAANNNSDIANAMTIIAQSLQPMQQAIVSIQKNIEQSQKEQEEFRDVMQAKTKAIENTLNFLRIDGYELKTLTLTMADKRERQRNYFEKLSEIYDAREPQISRVWDYMIYSSMYKHIGREKITPFNNKAIHVNQSVKDITKAEYPKCIDFIETYILDRKDFENKILESYGYRN